MASARDMKRGKTFNHQEAADFLKISPATLYNWVIWRRIPVVKYGRKNVYREADLQEYMDRRIQPADKQQ